MPAEPIRIHVTDETSVSGLLQRPDGATALLVLAHGAGAGMTHPFMAAIADGLAGRRIATLRYQFPYMEQGSRRPDRPALATATVRAAVAEASRRCADLPLLAGGKSFGGRMSSQAQAESPLAGVRGLVFFGFPLHPAGKPAIDRAVHLDAVQVPMLFLQGTRDELADLGLVRAVCDRLGARATLRVFESADHSFKPRPASGQARLQGELLDATADWSGATVAAAGG